MALDTEADLIVGAERTALNLSDSSIHDPAEAKKLGFRGAAVGGNVHLDLFAPVLVDAYGLDGSGREAFMGVLAEAHLVCRAFVAARVDAGVPAFVDALAATGGWERWDRAGAWIDAESDRFTSTLLR